MPTAPLPGTLLYAVWGTEGEYSDRSLWLVGLYDTNHKASRLCSAMSAWLQAYALVDEAEGWVPDEHTIWKSCLDWQRQKYKNHPRMGARYYVEAAFLHNDPDDYLAEYGVLFDAAHEQGFFKS